nr:nucleolar and coiled-body phosphoprotein 1-like isoform X2 [Ipomoea batatas]
MATIMSLIIEESEDVSVELLTQLLASVKKDSKDIMPIGKRLGEKLSGCRQCIETKKKPSLTQAVKSLDLSLNEYSKVLAGLLTRIVYFPGKFFGTHFVQHNGAVAIINLLFYQRAEDTQKGVCSEDVSHAVNTSPKSITSNGSRTRNGVGLLCK